MPLGDLLAAIDRRAVDEAAAIVREAEREAADVLRAARQEAKQVEADARRAALEPLAADRQQALTRARAQGERDVAEALRLEIDQLRVSVLVELRQWRTRPGYGAALAGLVDDALGHTGTPASVTASTIDARQLEPALGDHRADVEIVAVDAAPQGVVVTSRDGSTTVDQGLEPRLDALLRAPTPGLAAGLATPATDRAASALVDAHA